MEGGEEYVFLFLPLIIKGVPSGCSFPSENRYSEALAAPNGRK